MKTKKDKYLVTLRVNTFKVKHHLLTYKQLMQLVKTKPHRVLQAYRLGQEVF